MTASKEHLLHRWTNVSVPRSLVAYAQSEKIQILCAAPALVAANQCFGGVAARQAENGLACELQQRAVSAGQDSRSKPAVKQDDAVDFFFSL